MAADDLAFAAERSFLAQEFLTWLWFRCEVEGGEFDLESGGVAVVVEDALAFSSWDPDGTRATIRGGTPTIRPEAAGALGAGLVLRRARLLVARNDREWHFSLDGETLDLLGVKVPEREDEAEDDGVDLLVEKLAAGEELRAIVDGLYQQFLAVRLADDWDGIEVPRLNDWVKTKLEKAWREVTTA
jgi:hypothetical protein